MNSVSSAAVISFQEESITVETVEDWRFIRLHDQAPGDIPEEYEAELTRADVVEIFASIFGRGSCGKDDAPDAYKGPEKDEMPQQSAVNYLANKYSGRAGAQQLAAEFGLGDFCRPETLEGGEIIKSVYFHASSELIFDSYNIVSYDANLSKYSVQEHDIYARIEFSNTSYSPLYYYVDQEKLKRYLKNPATSGEIYEWRGSVIDENGEAVENPEWILKNGRVYFPGNWSGILIFKRLPIKYHLYTLKITGTVGNDATRNYDARVSAKTDGLSAVHLDISEEIRAEDTKERCPWLNFNFGPNGAGTGTETTFDDDDDDDDDDDKPLAKLEPPKCDDPITADEYNDECCGGPLGGCLPPCRSITTTVQGPVSGEEPDEYCGGTSVIVLMPNDGKPCGQMHKTWSTDSGNCCEGYYIIISTVNNKLEISGPGVNWSYFASVNNDNPVNLSPHVRLDLPQCGSINVKGSEEASGFIRYWQFIFSLYKDGELIKEVNVSGPGDPERQANEVYLVFNDTIEIMR